MALQHCKKLVLIPAESAGRLHEKPTGRTSGDVISDLDSDIGSILAQKDADAEKKWRMYEQALQRYMHFVKEQRKPIALMASEDGAHQQKDDTGDTTELRKQVAAIVPAKQRGAASALFDFLESPRVRAVIGWDSTGSLSIGDVKINQANIVDLVSDAVRTRKSAQALGWVQFVNALKQLNAPQELLVNAEYRDFMRGQKGSGTDPRHEAVVEGPQGPRGLFAAATLAPSVRRAACMSQKFSGRLAYSRLAAANWRNAYSTRSRST